MSRNTPIPTRLYYVAIRTTFDRPELRDSSYPFTPAAHSSRTDALSKASLGAAVAEYERARSGQWDFASEYCSRVEVYSTDLHGYWPRCERKMIFRVRDYGSENAIEIATEHEQFERHSLAKQSTVPPKCACGKPAVVRSLCRGCDEDRFYSRDIPDAKTQGME